LAGDSDVRSLMRACDWDATPLGPPERWPQSLRTIVRVMLTSRFAMWMAWGPELTFLCNDAYLPTVGVKRDWVIGSRSDKVWAEIWPDIGPRIDHVLRSGEATWDEALLLYLERSGFTEETYHTFSYSPLPDDSGRTNGMLCVVAEVTERVIGERQLAALRDLGAHLAAASTRSEVTAALESSLEAEPHDLPFALLYLAGPQGERPELAARHGMGSANPAAAATAWPLAHTEGGAIIEVSLEPDVIPELPLSEWQKPPERALIAPIGATESDRPIGYLVAGLNPHRIMDAAYRGFIELLTAQVAAAIARADQYEREHKRAEALAEIDRAKTVFFSNVSHEFRTPLTLMLGPLEDALAAAANAPDDLRERIAVAHRNALRLLRLVNALLDFSRIEAGRVQGSFRPTDLSALTADIASSFRSATDRAGLRLEVKTPSLSQPVYVDREMWEKILLNLLSNAFKFTFAGEIAVTLHEEAGKVRLAVRDTGTGIPPQELPKLFDRFHRIEGAQGRSFEGSGIGLALVQELAGLHGGAITVESELGRGSVFTVTLPLGSAHLPQDQIDKTAGKASTSTRMQSFVEEALRWLPGDTKTDAILDMGGLPPEAAPANNQHVLLADDNADLRNYIARLLTERGYRVESVADGEQALAAARARKPNLLITDVMMPRLDGFGLLRAVRDDPTLRDLPVIMLSARAGEEAKVEGLDAGADDYLTKPFSARELLARVATNITLARMRREAAEALRTLNEELEIRVARAILERQEVENALQQAKKMEAMGQLTGGVAHDFNNLLTPIIGSLDMLQRRGITGEREQRLVSAAIQSAERAKVLVQRLLAFARRQPLQPVAIDVAKLVEDMTDLVASTVGPQISVTVDIGRDLRPAKGDANQIEMALLNLCVNARDAMADGGELTIAVSAKAMESGGTELKPGNYICLSVTDSGLGMDEATLARAVEPFFSTKGIGRGTGLGLSMVHGLASQLGGALIIRSKPNLGTTAELWLPQSLSLPDVAETAEETHPKAQGHRSVLLVDDEEFVRLSIADMLNDLGYRVAEAASAQEAISRIEAGERFDLIITDHLMPGMTGMDLAREIRARKSQVPVLLVSGYADAKGIEADVPRLTKPFRADELAASLGQILA
jgi:signal transduction histidine kinase